MVGRLVGLQARVSTRVGITLGALALAVAGVTDYVTGPYLWWDFVYVIPIAALAWISTWRAAGFTSLLAGFVTMGVNLHWMVESRPVVAPYWNGLDTAVTCFTVATIVSKLRGLLQENAFVNRLVSHDLMNILTVMRMNTDLLARHAGSGETTNKVAENLATATMRMRRIVGDLAIASGTNGTALQIQAAPADALKLVADSAGFVAAAAQAKGIEFQLRVPERPVEIFADAERLGEVFDNLLGNAIKFTRRGGSIEVSLDERPDEVEVHVRDNGPGIDASERGAVFRPFWMGQTRSGGSGLGLYVAKVIVEKHGGTIWVADAAVGADFGVRLPRFPNGVGHLGH